MASMSDWLGNQVGFSHDGDGNLTSQANAVSTSHPSGTSATTFGYDNADLNTQAASTLTQTCGGSETLTQAKAEADFILAGAEAEADALRRQASANAAGNTNARSPGKRLRR